jgi:hypothetical protein
MPIVDNAPRDVEMRDGVAVEQKLLMSVVVEEGSDGERRQQHAEASLVALLGETPPKSSRGIALPGGITSNAIVLLSFRSPFYGHLCAPCTILRTNTRSGNTW